MIDAALGDWVSKLRACWEQQDAYEAMARQAEKAAAQIANDMKTAGHSDEELSAVVEEAFGRALSARRDLELNTWGQWGAVVPLQKPKERTGA